MEEIKVSGDFVLPNEVVTVKFVPRKTGMAANVDSNHVISGGMYDKAVRKFYAPLQRDGSIANVLTNAEKSYLESVTGIDLSVYGDFWETFSVSLHKEDALNKFELSKPFDYIAIKILEKYPELIATEWSDRNKKPSYQFVITRDEEEIKEKRISFDTKKEAWKVYGKIEGDREKLLGVLRLLSNKPVSKETTYDWIATKVEEYIDTMPNVFLNVVKDSSLETKILVKDAISKGIIKEAGGKLKTVDGLDLCKPGEIPTFDNAIRFLENPKNQDVLHLIQAKVNSK